MKRFSLPKSTCPLGYTTTDLTEVLHLDMVKFGKWIRGQTCTLCDGKRYDHKLEQYFTTECANMLPGMPVSRDEIVGGHGIVTYTWDVERYVEGRPVLDW